MATPFVMAEVVMKNRFRLQTLGLRRKPLMPAVM